ncbi:site-specific DNA-methyltransferase [Filifactor alocis]
MKLLQESYLGKVKMIYIDPPYNTGNDSFVYSDNFEMKQDDYEIESGQKDDFGNLMFVENSITNPRFHSVWCSMMYERLLLARNLLSSEGFIFISIDDNEMDNMKKICDEVFGSSNHCGTFIINSTPNARDYGHIGKMHEFCLFYAKNINTAISNMLPDESKTFKYKDAKGGYNIHPLYNSNEAFHKLNRPNLYYPFYVYVDEQLGNNFYNIGLEKKENCVEVYPPKSLKNGVQFVWRWGKEKAIANMNVEITGYEVKPGEYRIVQKMRHEEKIIRSLLTDTKYSSRRGTAEVEGLLNRKIFLFPKPLSLIKDYCMVGMGKDDIVLDFFSGSSTTAHAVMQLNAEDGGNRKFIMVQLPEKTDEKSEAYKAGYENICEIGKERIRRAGQKILEDNKDKERIENVDIGFRVLKIDDTNMTDVYYSPAEYSQNLLSTMESNVKSDRNDLDLLFGCLLEWGLPLSLPYRSEQIEGCTVHNYNDGDLIACFDENIPDSVMKEIAKKQPLRAVFRDSSFANSPSKINVRELFKLLAPDTRVKVI